MKSKFLGDSYDIVKQCLLRWLGALGPWATQPMFTGDITDNDINRYERLLGTRILSTIALTNNMERNTYFSSARECNEHVFFDPDTGIRLGQPRGKKALAYIFGDELIEIAGINPDKLVLVFDQSFARGSEKEQLKIKLRHFREGSVHSVAYVSHACFVLLCKNEDLIEQAFEILLSESRLPRGRFVTDKEAL